VRQFLIREADASFSYPEVGATRNALPAGYNVDHNRVLLGNGEDTFERACNALRAWRMFEMAWVRLYWPTAALEEGTLVAPAVRVAGFWLLNAARIAYVMNESVDVRRYGFAYGTLPHHAEIGEERFLIEWEHANGSVWYDLLAFSRPRLLAARVAFTWSRRLQKRFAIASLAAMKRAVQPPE